jgi:hypothetical protein
VSYTGTDINFATWVAEILEAANYSVIIQAWDFRPGDNLVTKINDSLKSCKKLIVILSESYLNSKWCEAEWTVKLAEQIHLNERRIIPIRISPLQVEGLLSPIIYIDIVDKSEADAKKEILAGVIDNNERKSVAGYPAYYNIEHIQIDNDYCVYGDKIFYQKLCKSRVLRGGFNKLHNRITWFADEEVYLTSLTENVKIEHIDLKDTNLNYNVVFGHELIKDEIIEYCIKAVLTNKNKHFKNFFSTEVIAPIESLNMHLKVIDSHVNKYYTQKIASSPMNVRTEKPVEHSLYEVAHWRIEQPEINFEYKVFW